MKRIRVVVTQHDVNDDVIGAFSWDVFQIPDPETLVNEVLELYGDCYTVCVGFGGIHSLYPDYLIVMEGRNNGTQN